VINLLALVCLVLIVKSFSSGMQSTSVCQFILRKTEEKSVLRTLEERNAVCKKNCQKNL